MSPDHDRALAALRAIPADGSRDDWVRTLMAAKAAGITEDESRDWSSQSEQFNDADFVSTWRSIKVNGGIGPGSLFKAAHDSGWRPPANGKRGANNVAHLKTAQPTTRKRTPAEVWASGTAAVHEVEKHPYLKERNIPPDGLRLVSGKRLAMPFHSLDGRLATLQLIDRNGVKMNLAGAKFDDSMFIPTLHHECATVPVDEIRDDMRWLVCEGLGQSAALMRADYHAMVAVSAGILRFAVVAHAIRARWPDAEIVLIPDAGGEASAAEVAADVGGAWLQWPPGWPANTGVDDFARKHDSEALADLLQHHVQRPAVAKPDDAALRYRSESLEEVIADTTCERWLVRGVLAAGGFMAIFGPSGSGKSFLAFDLLARLAHGRDDWWGHPVTQTPVFYLALEGASGQRRRALAWHQSTELSLPANFRMMRNQAFDLRSLADVDDLIALARADGIAGGVLVIDTLNKASPQADENSSAEVGALIAACDTIRRALGVAVVLIAHTGKVVANGLRGHSSLYAALDAAIECTGIENPRSWALVKAKDEAAGEQHGFNVESIDLGQNEDGSPISGGVAVPANDSDTPRDVPRPPSAPGQKLAYEVVGALLRASHDFGQGDDCPPTRPCVRFEKAVEALAPKQVQLPLKKRAWAARRTLSAMQAHWYVTDGEWLWHK